MKRISKLTALVLIITFTSLYLSGCSMVQDKFNIKNFDIKELRYDELPYTGDNPPIDEKGYADKNGVKLFYYNKKYYYNPVSIAQRGIYYLDDYHKTKKPEVLKKAETHALTLKNLSTKSRGALYLPYYFPFALHGLKTDIMPVPWYSGMAQGQALSLYTRLYETTKDKKYLELAELTFKSFQNLEETTLLTIKKKPWTVKVDKDGFYWIEEYPWEGEPTRVLNGFIFAIYGLYDYHMLKKDPESKNILLASMTTIKHYIEEFRNPGDISKYGLKHKVKSKGYHLIHISQLNQLYKYTGDKYFKTMADKFYNDYH